MWTSVSPWSPATLARCTFTAATLTAEQKQCVKDNAKYFNSCPADTGRH